MRLVFLWGMPASGKLTVARELSSLTGWKLFHNHLTVDLLLSVFPFGSSEFVQLREQIWLSVFESAATSGMPGLIFTFCPEDTVQQDFVEDAADVIAEHGGRVEFVQVTCDDVALQKRMDTPERRAYKKMVSFADFCLLRDRGVFKSPRMPEPALRVDTTQQSPGDAAMQIMQVLGLPFAGEPPA